MTYTTKAKKNNTTFNFSMTFMINKKKQYTSNKLGCRKYQQSYKIKSEQKNGQT